MWIRKSEAEIKQIIEQKETDKKNLFRPLMFATAVSAVVVLLYSFGIRGFSRGFIFFAKQTDGLNWRTISVGIFMFALFAVIAIRRQHKYGYIFGGEQDILCCRNCKEFEHITPNKTCTACGGKQEPTEYFTWFESETSKQTA